MDKRLIYRVILKLLFALAVVVLFVVLVQSLFTTPETSNSSKNVRVIVSLNIADMKEGEIRKTHWQGKEVAVLKRKRQPAQFNQVSNAKNTPSTAIHNKNYFVYINQGDSGNCPLFYMDSVFKDICTSKKFDNRGRELDNPVHGYRLKTPPYQLENNTLTIGSWGR